MGEGLLPPDSASAASQENLIVQYVLQEFGLEGP